MGGTLVTENPVPANDRVVSEAAPAPVLRTRNRVVSVSPGLAVPTLTTDPAAVWLVPSYEKTSSWANADNGASAANSTAREITAAPQEEGKTVRGRAGY